MKAYNIIVLSEKDSAVLINKDQKSFQFTCNGSSTVYTAEDVKAVIIKTMDTGPVVEDMYAEVHINDTIYIIPSESPKYNNIVLYVLNDIVALDLELFIEASMYHYNKAFVLYQKDGEAAETEDSDDKRCAILEASLKTLHEAGQSAALTGFILAIMSFCPMYLLFGKGEHKDQLVNLAAVSESMIPIFTSLDRCPKTDQYEKRLVSAEEYIKMFAAEDDDAIIDFNTDYRAVISSKQIKDILMPLVVLRNDPGAKTFSDNRSEQIKEGTGETEKLKEEKPHNVPTFDPVLRADAEAERIEKLKKERRITRMIGIVCLLTGYSLYVPAVFQLATSQFSEFMLAMTMLGSILGVAGLVMTARSFFSSKFAVLRKKSERSDRTVNRSSNTHSAPEPPARTVTAKTPDDAADRLARKQMDGSAVEPPRALHDSDGTGTIKLNNWGGFWVECLTQVHEMLSYMQIAVDIAREHGYKAGVVIVSGGVHELDTGYESFSGKRYFSFEEAKKQLPIDFETEEKALDGHWLNTLNFEYFIVNVSKNGVLSEIRFCRGEIRAPEELYKIYLETDWEKN